jgi:hypothetical protein
MLGNEIDTKGNFIARVYGRTDESICTACEAKAAKSAAEVAR